MARSDFKKRKDAQAVADRLVRVAIQRRTEDNVSVVVVDLGGGPDGWVKSPAQELGAAQAHVRPVMREAWRLLRLVHAFFCSGVAL